MNKVDEARFHESWLGMVHHDGLVVSVPVLTNAELMHQRGAKAQRAFRTQLSPAEDERGEQGRGPREEGDPAPRLEVPSLETLLVSILGFSVADIDLGAQLPEALHVVAADAAMSTMVRASAAIRRGPRAPSVDRAGADGDPFADDDPFADPGPPADRDGGLSPAGSGPLDPAEDAGSDPERSTAADAGAAYLALVWDLADADTGFGPEAVGRNLDRPDRDARWNYPPAAKFERLLRHARVPIGLLTNRTQLRLIYAPHGETTGVLTFDFSELAEVGGRPMLDAFLALLGRDRWLSQAQSRRLPALLEASRKQQAEVTERLASQVFDALRTLLQGFEAAASRDASPLLAELVSQGQRTHGTGEVYAGLLTVLLRLVFMLYAEDRGLLPIEHPVYQRGYSLLGLFDELQRDQGAHPDAMDRRFGAWSRLIATWRAIYDGVDHAPGTGGAGTGGAAPLIMPPRRGHLFDPDVYPFLEGRARVAGQGSDGARVELSASDRAAVQVPSVDDGTLYRVLDALLYLREGRARQRLSYRSLDVEQIGSVYEALMGYDVVQLAAPAVRMRARRAKGVWLSAQELLAVAPAQRAKWLKDTVGLDKAPAAKLAKAVAEEATGGTGAGTGTGESAQAGLAMAVLEAHAGGKTHGQRAGAGRLVVQPGDERRRTSSHYTPRELTEPVVRRTLAPILRTMDSQTSEALLNLKIVDPAMGSGAFLVEVVRQLGDFVVAAWQREGGYAGQGPLMAATLGGLSGEARPTQGDQGELEEADPVIAARRLVAQRCVYGVDKNPYAVNLAKLSLWLVTMSRDLPFTFVDHALRCGDSLVGLSLDQARAFDWRVGLAGPDPKTPKTKTKKKKRGSKSAGRQVEDPMLALMVARALERATSLRRQIVALAQRDGEEAVLERERLLAAARGALDEARLAADLCLSAFFAAPKDRARLTERTRRLDLLTAYLGARDRGEAGEDEARAVLEELRAQLLAGQAPFHWMLEFPEVFWEGRPDPLASGKNNQVAYFDVVVGNPPFMGGSQVSGSFGDGYRDWLLALHPGSHGNADLCAHFFRRSEMLLGPHGAVGFVGTNTIGQGDTRATGLVPLIGRGASLYDVTKDLKWPAPGAAVTVSIVHLAVGTVNHHIDQTGKKFLRTTDLGTGGITGRCVSNVNSRLEARPERADPVGLKSNDDLSSLGAKIYGQGFVLTPEQRDLLVAKDPRNGERIKPYLGGAEVNRNPDQGFDRYVIDFGDETLAEAERWPDLIEIVRREVKPERDKLKDNSDGRRRKQYWWHWGRRTPALDSILGEVLNCIVTSAVGKHLQFASQPIDRIFSHKLIVFPVDSNPMLATLQSRVHATWCWALSSTMKTDLNYSPSDCFRNYPFPSPDPRTPHPHLETLGERLDTTRSAFMLAHQIGLTTTYNLLLGFDLPAIQADRGHKHHAPATDPALEALRALHLELDQAVLDTYAARLGENADPAERALAPLFKAIALPPYVDPRRPDLSAAQKGALGTFNDAVLDALMALNEVRAAREARAAG